MKTGSPPTSDRQDPTAAPLMPIPTASATCSSHRPFLGVTLVTSLGFFVPSGVFPALDRSPSPASALLDVQRTDASDEISSTFKGLISRPVRNRRRIAGIRSPLDLSLLQGFRRTPAITRMSLPRPCRRPPSPLRHTPPRLPVFARVLEDRTSVQLDGNLGPPPLMKFPTRCLFFRTES